VATLVAASANSAPHPRLIADRLPRVVHHGGPFLRQPEFTTVTFLGDDPAVVARLERFGAHIGRSGWWQDVTREYCAAPEDCIGAGRAGRTIRITRRLPPRVRDVDVEGWIGQEAKGGALSGLGDDALVLVYLPAGVVLGDAYHSEYCGTGPRAYHRMLRTDGIAFPYAVIPRCHGEAETTATASHEILEAVTNPDPDHPGFRIEPGPAKIAFRMRGAEPADPCGLLNLDTHRAVEAGFRVQRAWSNSAAEKGADPCAPSTTDRPYVALVPRQPVIRLARAGETATVVLDAASDRAVSSWSVSALNLSPPPDGDDYLDVRLDRSEVRTGETVVLTLRLLRAPHQELAVIGLVSHQGNHSSLWPLAVSLR
jgi:hypothetical protein